jgi:hypothetical protein
MQILFNTFTAEEFPNLKYVSWERRAQGRGKGRKKGGEKFTRGAIKASVVRQQFRSYKFQGPN